MSSWLLIALAVITFANRFVFLSSRVRFTPGMRTQKFLSYSSFAVLTAIWTPIVFKLEAGRGLSVVGADYLIAVILAALLTVLKVRSIFVVLLSTALFFVLRVWVIN